MNNISRKLLKNGIQALLEQKETYFKKNVIKSLSIKLNDAITDVLTETNKNLLHSSKSLKNSKELQTFLTILEKKEKIILKDNSIINITENEAYALKELFEHLNTENRQKMIETVFDSSNNYNQHIEFYNNAKGMFR
jgi:hypothetical protein